MHVRTQKGYCFAVANKFLLTCNYSEATLYSFVVHQSTSLVFCSILMPSMLHNIFKKTFEIIPVCTVFCLWQRAKYSLSNPYPITPFLYVSALRAVCTTHCALQLVIFALRYIFKLCRCCVAEDIKFADTRTELHYAIGSSALIECVATGQPVPTVSWRFNRRKITPGNTLQLS